jgi:choline dehydrogenase-like flavoprotein
MLQSGVPDPQELIGAGLHLHPGVAVAGLFDEQIQGWKGIPQSVECTELLDFSRGSDRRVWITTAFAHPVGTAVMLPGFGATHREWMKRYPSFGVLTAMVHDESAGRVRVTSSGRARIEYSLNLSDRQQLDLGIKACARLLFAAGARRVLVPSVPPIVIESPAGVDALPPVVRPHGIPLTAVHPMGGLCFGENTSRAVMKSSGEHHLVRGLFACDGSLFPTGVGVPPQLSIYAFARRVAGSVARFLG